MREVHIPLECFRCRYITLTSLDCFRWSHHIHPIYIIPVENVEQLRNRNVHRMQQFDTLRTFLLVLANQFIPRLKRVLQVDVGIYSFISLLVYIKLNFLFLPKASVSGPMFIGPFCLFSFRNPY